jgi:DNA-binding NarL/FixJ family response regulator
MIYFRTMHTINIRMLTAAHAEGSGCRIRHRCLSLTRPGLSPFVLVLVLMVTTYDNGGRWRELRAQEAPQLDVARRTVPGERGLEPVREEMSAAKPLGLVWVVTSYPLVAAGLEKALESKADVCTGGDSVSGSPSCVVLYADGMKEGFVDGMGRIRELYPGVPLLVFGPRLDLTLAWAALKQGADGFVHAAMEREQVIKAVEVAEKGELVAPRQLLRYLLSQDKPPDVGALSPRQREVLGLVAEDLSNAEIAQRLYLSESTVKQHLSTAYKLLGVRNRTEAARMVTDYGRDW